MSEQMKACALGIIGGFIVGLSANPLYRNIDTSVRLCANRHVSEMCEMNYLATVITELAVALGLTLCTSALWWSKQQPRQTY